VNINAINYYKLKLYFFVFSVFRHHYFDFYLKIISIKDGAIELF